MQLPDFSQLPHGKKSSEHGNIYFCYSDITQNYMSMSVCAHVSITMCVCVCVRERGREISRNRERCQEKRSDVDCVYLCVRGWGRGVMFTTCVCVLDNVYCVFL